MAALTLIVLVTVPSPASAVIGDPTIGTTPTGVTSAPATSGKAQGSGLWGYVGDVETRTPGANTGSNVVWTYGAAISPFDGSLWVTDSAKIVYTTNAFACALAAGTVQNGHCYTGVTSTVNRYGLNAAPDWAIGQYNGDGTWSAEASGANGGIGANYQSLAAASIIDGTTATAGVNGLGTFGGARGVAIDPDGTVWVLDPDYGAAESTAKTPVRILNPDGTETTESFGSSTFTWGTRYQWDKFEYNVSIARMANGNFLIANGGQSFIAKEFDRDGNFVRTYDFRQPANTAYPGDTGSRNPYHITVDPTDGTILMRYTGESRVIERVDPNNCTPYTPPVGSGPVDPPVVHCAVTQTIVLPNSVPATGSGYAIGVDPLTEQIYAGAENGLLYVYESDGTYLGRFSAFGNGNGNGQIPNSLSGTGGNVRAVVFDDRGFMYLTVGEGSVNTRVEIFARTPDPVTNATGDYLCVLDGNGDPTGVVDRTRVDLVWDALPTGVTADGQVPLRDYVIESSTDGGATWAVTPTSLGTTASESLTGLNPVATYQFRISAWNEAGNGDTITLNNPTVPACTPPATTGSITVSVAITGATAPPGAAFDYTLTCTLVAAPVALAPADAVFTLAHGGTKTVTGIPAGAECTVTQTTIGTFTTNVTDSDGGTAGGTSDGVVTIVVGVAATVALLNAYPASNPPGTVATTGSDAPGILLLVGGVAVLLGLGLVGVSRMRRAPHRG